MSKKRFVEYLTVHLPNGMKKQMRFTSTKSRKEAKAKKEQAVRDIASGSLIMNRKTTVSKYAEKWQEQVQLSKDDRSRLKNYCVDLIGSIPVGEVRASHIRDCYMQTAGKSKSLVTKVCQVINRMFNDMYLDEIIRRNPCLSVQRPKGIAGERRAFTDAEEQAFLETLQKRIYDGHWYDIAFGISYACGLRPGEVRALTKSNIYLDGNPFIRVSQAAKDQYHTIGEPKTSAGKRDVPIPAWFVPMLRYAMSQQASLWLLPDISGKCLSAQTYKRRWKRFYNAMKRNAGARTYRNKIVASAIGDELTPYYLRHTYCTNLVYMRIPEIIAMQWMGHDDPNMVRKIYAHASSQKLQAQSLNDLNAYDPTHKNSTSFKESML